MSEKDFLERLHELVQDAEASGLTPPFIEAVLQEMLREVRPVRSRWLADMSSGCIDG